MFLVGHARFARQFINRCPKWHYIRNSFAFEIKMGKPATGSTWADLNREFTLTDYIGGIGHQR